MTTAQLTSIETFTAPFNLSRGDTALITTAHPDDIEMANAAAVAELQAAGVRIVSITATLGEASTKGELASVQAGDRLFESIAGQQSLGISREDQHHLTFPDGKLDVPFTKHRLAHAIARIAITEGASALITQGQAVFDTAENPHADHISVHAATIMASVLTGQRLRRPPLPVWGLTIAEPSFSFPVVAERKFAALAEHGQFEITRIGATDRKPGDVRIGSFVLSETTARELNQYAHILHAPDATEHYRRYDAQVTR